MSFNRANDPDILGGKLNPKPSTFAYFTGLLYLIAGGAFCVFVTYASAAWSRWKDRNNRLALRRRHGIPDSDQRAFNVAYAAAQLAQKKGGNREGSRNTPVENVDPGVAQNTPNGQPLASSSSLPANSLKHRASSSIPHIPGHLPPSWAPLQPYHQSSPLRESPMPQQPRDYSVPRINVIQATPQNSSTSSSADSAHRLSLPAKSTTPYSSSRIPSPQKSPHKALFPPYPAQQRLKRSLEDYDDIPEEGDEEGFKKTRVEGEQLIDGDEDAEWDERSRGSRRHVLTTAYQGKRGSKRIYDDDEHYDDYEKRDKRARKFSGSRVGDDMDIDESNGMGDKEMDTDARPVHMVRSRGRKRDRAEAGSTFGGDDEHDTDECMESITAHTKARKRERKRRHHVEDEDDATEVRSGQRRQGRKSRTVSRDEEDDTLMSDTPDDDDEEYDADSAVLSTSSGRRRRVGEEWEVHGVKFKMGRDGERLRQALVRSERSRFSMPSDSVHPDTQANLNVFVETWLTDEEYELAKERQALAWQDGSVGSMNEDRGDVETPHSLKRAGKDLLWASQTSPTKPRPSSPAVTKKPSMGMSMYQVGIRTAYNFPKSSQQHRITASDHPDKGKGKDKENEEDADKDHTLSRKPSTMARSISGSSASGEKALTASTLTRSISGSNNSTKRMTGSGTRSPRPSLSSSHHGNSFSKWEKQDLEAESMRRIREGKEKSQPTVASPSPTPAATSTPTPPSFSVPSPTADTSAAAAPGGFKPPSASASAPKPFGIGLGGPSSSTSPAVGNVPKVPSFFPPSSNAAGNKPVNPSPLGVAPPLVAATSTPAPAAPKPEFKVPAVAALNTAASTPAAGFGAPASSPAPVSGKNQAPQQNGFSFGAGSNTPSTGGSGGLTFGKPQTIPAPAAPSPVPVAPKPVSAFGSAPTPAPQPQQQPQPAPPSSPPAPGDSGSKGPVVAGSGAPLKFNFGVAASAGKSNAPSPSSTPAPVASATNGAGSAATSAPAQGGFKFGAGGSNAFSSAAAPSPFGAPAQPQTQATTPSPAPSPAAFGFSAPQENKAATPAPATSAFSFGGNNAASQSFGNSSSSLAGAVGQGSGAARSPFGGSASSSSPFGVASGAPSSQNVFGSSSTPSQVFGGTTTPANKPPASTVFGAPGLTSSASQDASTTPKGSPFTFSSQPTTNGDGSTTPVGTPTNAAPPATPFKFNFGGAGQAAPAVPATPAKFTFGFGGGDSKPASSTFNFGQK